MSSIVKARFDVAARRRRHIGQRRQTFWAVVFLTPAVVALAALRIAPTIGAIVSSLYKAPPGGIIAATFHGLGNYKAIFGDTDFVHTIWLTLLFNVVINPVQVFLALLIAVLMTRQVRWARVWKTFLFIPITIPIVGSSIAWSAALAPKGPINALTERLGGQPQPFFTSPDQALASIGVVASWIGIGYWMVFLIAGIEAAPEEVYEAARLDRAGPIRTFFSITVPLLKRPILFVLVADTVANFVLFVPVQLITNGGPQGSTNLAMFHAYRTSFGYGSRHLGAAEVVILTMIMLVFVFAQFRLLREEKSDA